MKRYWLPKQDGELYVSQLLENRPKKAIEFNPSENLNFFRPVFNDYENPTHVIESATSDDVAAVNTPIFMEKLQETVVDLVFRAEKAAIDKTGSEKYIKAQIDLYKIKYRVALGEIQNAAVEALIRNEANEFGVDYAAFCELIIWMYETSLALFEKFQFMIERCRTKIQTLIENRLWIETEIAFSIVETLNNVDQADAIMTQILNL